MFAATFIFALLTSCIAPALAVPTPLMRRVVSKVSVTALSELAPFTQFARAAYCQPEDVLAWTCGEACEALAGFKPTIVGGDGGDIQFFFVGFWPAANTVVVSHQGTDPLELESILTDLRLNQLELDQALFPGTPALKVHAGFRDAQAETAPIILEEVRRLLAENNSKKIITVGHSLGGALAVMDALMFSLVLPADVVISTVTYGSPRVGNKAFATLFDQKIPDFKRITNDNDLVPIIPGRFLGFEHSGDEIHLDGPGNAVACSGNDNAIDDGCSVKTVPNILFGNIVDHLGPYEGIFIGSIFCN